MALSKKAIQLSSFKFVAASTITQQLQQAKHHLRLQYEVVKLGKYTLIKLVTFETEQEAGVFFELIAHHYKRRCMINT